MHSPTRSSPIRARRQQQHGELPSFMRRPPKPEGVKALRANASITTLSPAELEERYNYNARILSETSASSSKFTQQLEDQQAVIKARLNELGVEDIRSQLERAKIEEEESMNIDPTPEPASPPPQEPQPIGAKQRALARWGGGGRASQAATMTYTEADQILRESFQRDQEHKQKLEERRRRRGEIGPGENLTRAEKDARMLAFLSYKPSESDLEDDDDDEEEDAEEEEGRPAWWDEDDQEDGIKGQDIVEPDYYDGLDNIIRIDEARIPWAIPPEE